MTTEQDHDHSDDVEVWDMFAAAALSSGTDAKTAAKRADDLMRERRLRAEDREDPGGNEESGAGKRPGYLTAAMKKLGGRPL